MVPLLVPTDIPEIEPVETVPALLVMVVLVIVPEPLLPSSGAEMVPVLVLVPTVRFDVVHCPAELMVPLFVPTDMPEMEPVETVPALLVMVVLVIVPEPLVPSSGAEMVPLLVFVPTVRFDVVPCPAALIVPLFVPTDIPEIEPVDTVPALLVMVVLVIVPEPLAPSSGAEMVPLLVLVPTVKPVIVP